jgi:hypothetical protein
VDASCRAAAGDHGSAGKVVAAVAALRKTLEPKQMAVLERPFEHADAIRSSSRPERTLD